MPEQNQKSIRAEAISSMGVTQALVHVCNSLLLRVACVDMNDDGESKWLNLFLSDLDKQPLQQDAKELILDMVSAVETTLREIVNKDRAEKDGD